MEGYLSKWTNMMNGWQYRWFVLDDNSGILSYYTSKEKMLRGNRRGCVRLKGAVVGIDDQDECTFTISVDHKTFHFQTKNARDREDWVRVLEDTIHRHSLKKPWTNIRPVSSIVDFEKKVSETDTYLQIMIEEAKKLKCRIDECSDNEQKIKYQKILDHANAMLDNVKHSIVLLQIAKNTAHPVNGGVLKQTTSTDMDDNLSVNLETDDQQSQAMSSLTLHNEESANNAVSVPEVSYSSSENDDDFYDANDFSGSLDGMRKCPETSSKHSKSIQDDGSSGAKNTLDYDALYENLEEDSNRTLDNNGSVITHLLSQVKIGMDLTKVALPTFILERRSLLEMYADYFAHPDIFLKIVEMKTPKERFVQVVRWYLSSFHAGRKSSVAKKPYNPILGEVFRCFWDSENDRTATAAAGARAAETDPNCPIPWCTKDQLVFIAEQVSHHPPVSAFYAEHFNKKISFCAHVYTKSRFLGLSVCVYNIGEGIVSLPEHKEDYVVTFPNGYGRSILTVPWIELGGSTTIECPQTGYKCQVEFHTKPFYGNKKNRITAVLYEPHSDKKSFLTISGEWNGVMEARRPDNDLAFSIDVNRLEVKKKIVKPIAQQDENESRHIWKEVTAGLKFNDIDRATNSKMLIEQKQRDEAKNRKLSNEKWSTKYFVENDEKWTYVNPLKERLQQ